MEDPFIDKPSSSSERSGFRRMFPPRRSDAIAHGTTYEKAAALVDLAEDGIGLPVEVLDEHNFDRTARLYLMINKINFLWSLNLFALIVLNFLEMPLWCSRGTSNVCNDRTKYYLGELPYLTPAQSLFFEGSTLFILILQVFLPLVYMGTHLFWKNDVNKLKVVFLFILIADLVVDVLYVTPGPVMSLPLRIAPYARVIIVILNVRELRACMLTLAGMISVFLDIVALWILFLLICSWLAYVIFEDTSQGKIFKSYGATLYQMFVLFTTSNNPDVWIPAYKTSRWYSLFFVLYVLLGVYFVTNLILAVVYDSFKDQLAKQVAQTDTMQKHNLSLAFKLIDDQKRGFIDKDQCIHLLEELTKYRTLPRISREDFEYIFYELDDSGDFKINLDEFYDLCLAISLQFQKEASPSWFEKYPSFYHSALCKYLKGFVRSSIFGYIIFSILALNLVTVIIETTLDIENNSSQKFWQKVEFFFGWIYVLEMALKVFSYGFDNYWREGPNRFDFVITWVIVIGETISFTAPHGLDFLSNGEWIRYLLIARMLRLTRLLMHVHRYRAFVATFFTLIPSLMPYLGTVFCVLCIYCSLGLQLFGGLVYSGNPKLESTDLWDDDYLLFNFNDYPNGMVTLFNLLVMGNWQVWMQSYVELTGTSWAIVFFASFYVITVLMLLNLIVAFVLEAFFAEMELESTQDENRKDRRSSFVPQLRVSSKRSGRVHILLHHMLSAELEKNNGC
ncbi:two pore calcium channel protein 1A [Nymphaea colorata]|nr:two pore calcium channel protein 1A [Nymphaea colorata]